MRCWIVGLIATSCVGCATVSLEGYTLNQIQSAADYRTQEVLNCLAMVAADPGTVPAFSLLADGTTRIQDMKTASSITLWTRALRSFALETLGITLSRSPQEQWTLSPVAEHEQLAALRCA